MERAFVEEKLKEITQKLVREFQPEKVILFGSWAWGTPTRDSDVDLFIVQDASESTRETARRVDGSIFPRPFPIDIIVYRPEQVERRMQLGDFFIKKILNEGRTLYAK
jgi:predicted nucleotidyltransferase